MKYNLNFVHFCDAASVDSLNRLSILGIFNRIFLPSTQNKFPKITIVMNITMDDVPKREHKIEIIMADPTNKLLDIKPPIKLNFQIPEGDKKSHKPEVNLIIELRNLEFKHLGKHLLKVLLDGKEIGNKELLLEEKTK